jgi:hypothetical protein
MAESSVVESVSTPSISETPSYQPPANEPQGLDPIKDAEAKEPTKSEAKESTVKLPASVKVPVKTGRFQERISDLVSQRDLNKREADQLRDQLARLQSGTKTSESIPQPSNSDGGLNPEDFKTYGDYIAAMVKSTMEQREASQKSQQAKTDYETHKQERMATFNEHAAPLAQQYGEGFWDTITDPSLPITEAMADAVMELDQLGPYTMLYLAAHKDESARIAKLNPRAATIAIGRLAAQLDQELKQGTAPTGETGQVTEEPVQNNQMGAVRPTAVPTPRGSSPSLNNTPNDKDSVDEWLRKETDRLRRINPNARFYGARLLAGLALLGSLLAIPMTAEASCQIILIPDGNGGMRSCQVCTWPNGQVSTTCS